MPSMLSPKEIQTGVDSKSGKKLPTQKEVMSEINRIMLKLKEQKKKELS